MSNDPMQSQFSPYQQPYPQQPAFQPPPKKPSLWRRYRARSRRFQWGIGCAVIIGALVICGTCSGITATLTNTNSTASTANTPTATSQAVQPTNPPAHQPTAAPASAQYPPKTKADLQTLAALGDASAIHEFHAESVGLTGVCPQPKREVTVDPSITGKKLIEDLLAYFYANQLDSPCGSIVFAYHSQAEVNGNGYTAGRINFDATDSSGSENTDPNATNLNYTVTLDAGDVTTGQEYVVSY